MESIRPLTTGSVTIGSELFAWVVAEAATDPAREVCGLLLGIGDAIEGAIATKNVAADPMTTFEIDPQALIAAHRAARAGGPKTIGCYHSHPSGQAVPSTCDLAAAEVGALWLIIAGGEARLWRRGVARFVEVVMRIG